MWTLQANTMDGNLFGVYGLKPDQIQLLNPLLIIAMIPLFQYVIYPLLAKRNLLKRPLQRMTTGGILVAISFIIYAFLQLRIESSLTPDLSANSAHLIDTLQPNSVSMFWQLIQYTVITSGEIMFCVTGLEFAYSQVNNYLQ
jgi:dipeptide/tripeptide permease